MRFPSVATCWSTTSAPALRRSVRMLAYEVSVRPDTTPASTSVHGPWQMAATGLPESTKSRTNATAALSSRNLSGLTVPPGVVVLDRCISYQPVDRKGASGLKVVVTGLDLAIVQGQQIGLGSCLSQRVAWLLYLDPLNAVCGQNGHSFSSQLCCHFLLPFLMLPTRLEVGYPGDDQSCPCRWRRFLKRHLLVTVNWAPSWR
jgi:hypothetical protein